MKLYSFSFSPGMINDFNQVIPLYKGKKIFRNFLLNEYKIPDNIDDLIKEENVEVQPYRMTDSEIEKIDQLISESASKGIRLNRSVVMRSVFNELINKYKDSPIVPSEQKAQRFKVPSGTIAKLNNLLGSNANRTFELSSFIMEDYVPSNDFPSVRNEKQEDLFFQTDIEVFDKMDEYANEYNFKRGGRTKIFRDAVTQFIKSLESDSPKKAELEQRLKRIIEEYKQIEDMDLIKENIEKYLK